MKAFRKNVAIAIDGGGIKGVIPTRALSILESHLGQTSHEIFRLVAGTSTGSIISAGVGLGLTGDRLHQLYLELGESIFKKSLRSRLWPLTRFKYPIEPLGKAFREQVGDPKMGDYWSADPPTDVVITVFDVVENRTRFVKPWKTEYVNWPVSRAVLASCAVPTYFPPIEGRYVDGGVGSYTNPCYLAAYELQFCLGWDPAETTLISLGTGRDPNTIQPGDVNRYWPWQWIEPLLGAFLHTANDQQVHLVGTFFEQLDFRRFDVEQREPIAMDDVTQMDVLTEYGNEMGRKILNDEMEPIPSVRVAGEPGAEGPASP